MLVLVCHSLAWTLSNTAGPAISGHSTAVVRDRLYLFGGLLGSAGSAASNKTWVYDGIWEEVDASGPSRRMYSAAAELDDAVYIFGGWDPDKPGSGGTFKDDVWKFDTRRCTWQEVSKMPKAVSRHAACRVNDAIVVCTFRETLVYERGQLRVQPTSGVPPAGLSMCACSAINGELVVFGGATRTQEMTNDVYVLNMHNWTWRKQLARGDIPTKRAGASLCSIDATKCLMYGGGSLGASGLRGLDDLYMLTVYEDMAQWVKLPAETTQGRVASSLDALDNMTILHGGWNPQTMETYDSTFTLCG